jgi:hypothetical protein
MACTYLGLLVLLLISLGLGKLSLELGHLVIGGIRLFAE